MLTLNWNIIWIIVNLIVLFLLLKHFLFGPITTIMEERKKLVDDQLNQAESDKKEAAILLEESKRKRQDDERALEAKLAEQMKIRMDRADVESKKVIENANALADDLLEKSRIQAEKEREEMLDDAKNEMTELAILAAKKIANAHPDEEMNKNKFQELLTKAGEKRNE